MNKTHVLGGVGIVGLVVVISVFFLRGKSSDVTEEIEPTPTPVYEEVDSSVEATLVPNAKKTAVSMKIEGLGGNFSGIEYELNYETDKGPKGTLSGAKPIPLPSGAQDFEREIELGTCSTGGKCTYDSGVKNFNLFVKLTGVDGKIRVLRKTVDTL